MRWHLSSLDDDHGISWSHIAPYGVYSLGNTGDLLILPSLEMLEMLEMSRESRADVSIGVFCGVFCPFCSHLFTKCSLLHCLILQLVEFLRYASAASAWFQEISHRISRLSWKDLEILGESWGRFKRTTAHHSIARRIVLKSQSIDPFVAICCCEIPCNT